MIEHWHVETLVCPTHRSDLARSSGGARGEDLVCPAGCRFPVVQGVAVMLPRDTFRPTHENALASLDEAHASVGGAPVGDTTVIERPAVARVDAWVQEMVAHTNSTLYSHLVGRLGAYPIPVLPLDCPRQGATLLDVGCGWGRWSHAAARKGFSPIGIDTSLKAALAATRVAAELRLAGRFVVADSRYLPFWPGSFDAAWSYSVLQHFAREDVVATLDSLKPLMRAGGISKLHVLNALGLRSILLQASRGFRGARGFETRYWRVGDMVRTFGSRLGPSRIELDGFFVQGRYEDRALFRPRDRLIVEVAHLLARATERVPALRLLADNLYVVTRH
jgi:2-polyprenyl-3-methyl-5-hydroxy-6-metoxy-1,4-benzoquinol methylase/uncharacterized protein YbaR (Trm112 family)